MREDARTDEAGWLMLGSDDSSLEWREPSAPPGGRRSPQGKVPVPYDGTIRLVGHRVREVQPGVVQVEARITCEGRTFSGAVAGPVAPPDRLSLPAIATL